MTYLHTTPRQVIERGSEMPHYLIQHLHEEYMKTAIHLINHAEHIDLMVIDAKGTIERTKDNFSQAMQKYLQIEKQESSKEERIRLHKYAYGQK